MNSQHEKLHKLAGSFYKKLPNLQIQVESSSLDTPFLFSGNSQKRNFHSASVGKMMTAMVIVQAIEKGLLNWDTPILEIVEPRLIERLFVSKSVDYSSKVTISHLLGHTSGINDYFEGKSTLKPSLLERVVSDPEKFYTPEDLLNITRNHQVAIGAPGEKFFYSDTGYILLGLIAEQIYKKPFFEILNGQIFHPLEMQNTGLLFYEPKAKQDDLGPVILKNKDIRLYKSLSIDFSGGGLSTTTEDLTRFLKALYQGKLIHKTSYERMANFENHFKLGMFYGLGLMELRFEKFFFTLKGLPRLQGHLGILGVHAWFDPNNGDTYVINVGDIEKIVPSFQLLIQMVPILKR